MPSGNALACAAISPAVKAAVSRLPRDACRPRWARSRIERNIVEIVAENRPSMPLADLSAALWRRIASTPRVMSRRRVVLHGITLESTRVVDPQTQRDLRRGRYQQAKAAQLASKIEPNDSFLEVGAGLGFTALLTRLAGRRGECRRR